MCTFKYLTIMKNDNKKKQYFAPSTLEQFINNSGVLCASGGDRVSSNVNIHGGDKSGDVADAF